MQKGKILKYVGLAIMIGSLVYMIVGWIQGETMNPILIGLVGVSLGNILNYYGNKSIKEEEHV